MHKTHSSWDRAASLPLALTLQICLEMTGECVAGPGWGVGDLNWDSLRVLTCSVGDLGGCQVLITLVSCVAGPQGGALYRQSL